MLKACFEYHLVLPAL